MPIVVLMPALSPTMTEGNLVKWHKKAGDMVKAGDLLAEIETDKATMEVEAVDGGKLGKILVAEGTENVAVNTQIAVLLEAGETEKDLDSFKPQAPAAAPASAPAAPIAAPTPQPVQQAAPQPLPQTQPQGTESDGRIFASPLARRIATQKGVDLASIDGSGPRGRIIRVDVENAKGGSPLQHAAPALPAKDPNRVLTQGTQVLMPFCPLMKPSNSAISVKSLQSV